MLHWPLQLSLLGLQLRCPHQLALLQLHVALLSLSLQLRATLLCWPLTPPTRPLCPLHAALAPPARRAQGIPCAICIFLVIADIDTQSSKQFLNTGHMIYNYVYKSSRDLSKHRYALKRAAFGHPCYNARISSASVILCAPFTPSSSESDPPSMAPSNSKFDPPSIAFSSHRFNR